MRSIEEINEVKMNKAIYIHIPFCAKKCYYCDFTSYVGRDEEINSYLDSLEKEMDLYMDKKEDIYSIFIGGGTPSLLSPDQLDRLFVIIEKKVNLESLCEYTIESNPGTLTRDKLRTMKKHGVNRLSMGLQAVQDKHLKFMGRIHDMDQFVESFELARQEGLENINVDLIFAFEGQTLEDWKESLEKVVAMNPDHISAYSLIIEEGTTFYRMYQDGRLNDFDEDTYISMYRYTVEKLKDSGYHQYEISNYAKEGCECKHNILYWDCLNYYGFGLGASGFIGDVRYTNTKNMKDYMEDLDNKKKPIEFKEVIASKDRFNEKIILGLRKNEGILLDTVTKYLTDKEENDFMVKVKNYIDKGLLLVDNGRLRLGQEGREVSNSIFVDLMVD